MHLRFMTAGESHGRALVTILEGLPAGLPLTSAAIDHELGRRMEGYGRGARMKIEQDRIEWLSGVRAGETLGSPLAMLIPNRDWTNWEDVMAHEAVSDSGELRRRRVARPRPGHADLSGVLKYDRLDARDILERASARETAARVAAGAVARRLLEEFGIEIGSHVVSLGGIIATVPDRLPSPINATADQSLVRCLDAEASARMVARIDEAKAAGDTLGGEIEVVATGAPVGLGSHVSWDRKLDGRLASMLMAIPAIKAVEIGLGCSAARRPGSEVHDPISKDDTAPAADPRGGFRRATNRAGGLEGGITTGEPIVVRLAMKPIATLMQPLRTVDLRTGEPANAQSERSDVTAVPAAGVIGEAVVALVLADAMLEKFGGDSLAEMRRNYDSYLAALGHRWQQEGQRGE
ncbi:MAG TPA: chorismate synthase [Gemmatimonadales bacterium]|nr:chorismate synthase [Gemmatimonadales bacterium]